jgi:glycosyltransferase 2 family protein
MTEDAESPAPTRHVDPAAQGPRRARKYAMNAGKLLLSCGFGCALLWALHRGGVPLVPAKSTFALVRWWTIPIYVALLVVSTYFRAVRWRLLLRPLANVSAASATSAVMVGTAATLLLPLRLGEMVRPYLIARGRRVPLLGALATVVAERIIDGLVLSLILAAALLLVPMQFPSSTMVVGLPIPIGAVRGYAWTFLMVFATALTIIVAFHASRERSVRLTRYVFGKLSPRFGEYVATRLDSFGGGLDFFRHRRLAVLFLFETAVYWGTAALSFWLLAWSVAVTHADGSSMTFGEACAVMGVLSIASVLPGPPGLLGLFQTGAYAAMTMYFSTEVITGAGSAYVFLLYVLQMGTAFAAAGVCLLAAALNRRATGSDLNGA